MCKKIKNTVIIKYKNMSTKSKVPKFLNTFCKSSITTAIKNSLTYPYHESNKETIMENEIYHSISTRYPRIKGKLHSIPSKIGIIGITEFIFATINRFLVPCNDIYVTIAVTVKTIALKTLIIFILFFVIYHEASSTIFV